MTTKQKIFITDPDALKKYCAEKSLKPDAFFAAVLGISLNAYNSTEEAEFSVINTIDSGSFESSTKPGNSVKVSIPYDGKLNVNDYIMNCQKLLDTERNEDNNGSQTGNRENPDEIILLTPVGEVSFDTSYYSDYRIKGIIKLSEHIAAQLLINDAWTNKLSDLTLVTEEEKKTVSLLYDSSYTVQERPAYRLLQDSAVKFPDRTAFIAADRTLTYRELNEEANSLGHLLCDDGVKPDTIVAVLAERNSYAYVMRQGVLKSGGAFMPIDPEYPEDRISYILEDSGAKHLVTTGEVLEKRKTLFDKLASSGMKIINVIDALKSPDRTDLNVTVSSDALAYVIYTSGSTGKPKGVMLTNKNLVNFVDDNEKNREIQGFTKRAHVSLAIAALTFDVSVMEEFIPFANGMTSVLATKDEIMNPMALSELMVKNNVDVMSCTPSYIMNLLDMSEFTDVFDKAVKNLKSIDLGAEAFPPALYDKLHAVNPDIYIMNGYGPTEATISCTMKVIENSEDITIGIPNANVSVCTIDRDLRLQPPGALGEMVILGDGVGRGYIGRDDLTEKCFIRMFGKPAYRSGDLVCIREDGNIEFHGRIDNQVKLRGLRVELGEIESVINSYPSVRSSIVIVVKQESEYLAAYFTADEAVDINKLREHLSSKLTEYMVPQVFLQLSEMPLTANGKIDKKALPVPGAFSEEVVPAQNETQEKLLSAARSVLSNQKIGINTDLFNAGLSSIGCMRFCVMLYDTFGKNVKVSEVYECGNVTELEKLISEKDDEADLTLRDQYPLSMTQTGIYIECARFPNSTTYNLPNLYKLDPSVDLERLEAAVRDVIRCHPYLLMQPIKDISGNLFAKRRDEQPFEVKRISCDKLPTETEMVRPYYLNSGEVLFRAEIYETKEANYFFFDTHHIVSDGGSIDILLRDIERVYQGETLEKESYTGFEYALQEAAARKSDSLKKAKDFYDSIFRGCGGETLPVKDGNANAGTIAFERTYGTLDVPAMKEYCDKHSITLNAFFTAAFGLALSAYTVSEQAVFTVIYNGRNDIRLENSVSMLVKTLPVCLPYDGNTKIADYISNCRNYLLSAMANDVYSFSEIKEAYGIKADIMMAFQGEYEHGVMLGGKFAELKTLSLSRAVASLGIDISLDGDKVVYEKEYDPSLYSDYTVGGLVRLVDHIASEILKKEKLSDITLTTAEDESEILSLYDTAFEVPERPAYRLLQDAAEKYPDRKALIATDRTLTYKELNEEANALGHFLKAAGAEPDAIIAVLADRNSYAYVMRQGILKSGGAFLPIDPEYPEDRIRYILEDSGAKLLVTTGEILEKGKTLFDRLASSGVKIISVDDALSTSDRNDLDLAVSPDALAYVIYTSGSTGRPKGVMLTNQNLVNFVDDNEKNHEVQGYTRRGHVSLAIAALTFDFSIMEEFVPIANSMTVVLATHEEIMNPLDLSALMNVNHVDVMSCTPSYLMNLLDMGEFTDVFNNAVKNLRSVDLGAEAFPPALYEKLTAVNPDIYIMNGYGPTEATISCTMQVITDTSDITIGIPAANVSVCTIDRDLRLQPPGALGEMVILGSGVGRGYIGRDDLTKKCFIEMLGKPAYRSGDLVRLRKDGNIEFHGRIDNQVKLRGLRVELGEIESVLGSFPGISACIVVVVKGSTDYLAAYFTADSQIDINALKAHLSDKLTAYMVPQAFMQLPKMPLTANGKIDKKALPEPNVSEEALVPAQNQMQEILLQEVSQVLGENNAGITTDLFEAGLSSIGSIKLCTLLSEKFKVNVVVSEIFENKTVVDLEKLIADKLAATDNIPKDHILREVYPLTMTQTGIFIESQKYPDTTIYNIPEIYKLDPSVNTDRLEKAIEKAVAAHPYLFMTVDKNNLFEPVARRRDNYAFKVKREKCEKLPELDSLAYPFDLTSGEVLIRAAIYETAEGNYFFMDTHHIVSDGESESILIEDINRAYDGEEIQKENYTGYEYALDETSARNSDRLKKAKDWYDSVLLGCGGDTMPIPDVPDSRASEEKAHIANLEFTGETDSGLVKDFCREHSLSVNALFITAFGLALKSYTASDQAVFSTIYNGRNDPRLKNSVTMLVKTLPVILSLDPETDSAVAVSECQNYLVSAMSNDIFSFSEVRNAYDIRADIIFAFQGDYGDDISIGGKPAKWLNIELNQTKSMLDVDSYTGTDKVIFRAEYDPSVYSEYTVSGLIKMTDLILGELCLKETLQDIELTTEQDRNAILSLHDTDIPVEERPAYRLLQETAEKFPERKAVVAADRTLTYKELNEEANALGHFLIDSGVKTETIVAVFAERNSYAYVMRQGVLKSGGAFLPINPEYPEDRINYILEDSAAKLLVTTTEVLEKRKPFFDKLTQSGIKVLNVLDAIKSGDRTNPDVPVAPDNLAYVIFTSGSTGKPKGVMLTNKGLVNFIDNNDKNPEIHEYTSRGKVSLSMSPFTFDMSLMEEFFALSTGMTSVISTHDEIMNPSALFDIMTENCVDAMMCTPSYILSLLDIDEFEKIGRQLKCIIVGAEEFPPALFDKLKALNPDILVMNAYGPTEATISCTAQIIESSSDLTIGVPNANVSICTIDRDHRLQPLGALGEMVILGDGVGRGYIGHPDLTAKCYTEMLGRPAYRSGDLVRIREDGNIEYHGRIDNQVKLRGLRVELESINSQRAPEKEALASLGISSEAINGIDELTDTFIDIFKKVLSTDNVEKDSNFFNLGGTSLTAAKVMMAAMSKNLPIVYQDVFNNPTPLQLATIVAQKHIAEFGEGKSPDTQESKSLSATEEISGENKISDATASSGTGTELPEPVTGEAYTDPADDPLYYNTVEYLDEIPFVKGQNLVTGNVAVAGVSGFLGIHVLKELIDSRAEKIYCLVHGRKVGFEEKIKKSLENFFFYYFDDIDEETFRNRVVIVDADITNPEKLKVLEQYDFDTLINCAACVKHFAKEEMMKQVNVYGVMNLAEICLRKNARLIHISTTSIAGDSVGEGASSKLLKENCFDLGQDVESNVYVHTKYLAEKYILDQIREKGLDAKIMRVGNLMSRHIDGEFQINFHTNNFMNTLKAYAVLGCFPVEELYEQDEFSPVDEVARAVVMLSYTPDKFTVFHPYNSHSIEMGDVIDAMNKAGVKVDIVDSHRFEKKLRLAIRDENLNQYMSPLVGYNLEDDDIRVENDADNSFTVRALYRLGFKWPLTSTDYISKSIEMMKTLGFFDVT